MRLPLAPLFVVLACTVAVSMGVYARSASGSDDAGVLPLPTDAARFGFELRGRTGGDVALLCATRPFDIALGNGPLRGSTPSDGAARRAALVLERELVRYPRAFLHRVRLAGVVLAADLTENGAPIPSLPNVGGLLLLDVEATEVDLVRTLHHEVFHFIDLADDGKLSPDPVWSALNAGSSGRPFAYGSGGRSLRAGWAGLATDELPGFVSAYATSGVEEDKAETFAFAMARPEVFRAQLAKDAVLTAKERELERRLAALDPLVAHALAAR